MSTPSQLSFFDLATRYDALSHNGDPYLPKFGQKNAFWPCVVLDHHAKPFLHCLLGPRDTRM